MNYNEKVISILNSRELTEEQKAKLEEIFPDLRESKDERIRKYQVGDTIYYSSFGRLVSFVIANIVEDGTDNPMYEDKDGNSVFEKDLVEQKHAETEKGAKGNDREIPNSAWSKDDEYYYGIIQYCLNNEIVGKADKENAISWFQSLKERAQSEQEWGEEDEELLHDVSDTYFYNDEDYPEETYKLMLKRVLDWMTKRAKSLKPQSQWKPCDLPHWKKSTLPNDNTTGFNSDYFCHKGYYINYKELFEKLPKDD